MKIGLTTSTSYMVLAGFYAIGIRERTQQGLHDPLSRHIVRAVEEVTSLNVSFQETPFRRVVIY